MSNRYTFLASSFLHELHSRSPLGDIERLQCKNNGTWLQPKLFLTCLVTSFTTLARQFDRVKRQGMMMMMMMIFINVQRITDQGA
jgi:hypothetical protein